MNKLISVIIPVYNVADYLKICIDSVLKQSYNNLEIILVDDGSTDISGNICDDYALKDNRIVVIHKENGGLSDARNAGMQIATGEYIAFVDSDDFIHKDMYRTLKELLEQYDADLAIANWVGFTNGQEDKIKDRRTGKILTLKNQELLQFLIHGKSSYKISYSVWDRLYKRELIQDFCFPKGKCYEDVLWSAQIFHKAVKGVYIDKSLYYYRRREDSIVGKDSKSKLSKRVITDEIPQIEAQIEFLKSVGEDDLADEVMFFLYQLLLNYYTRSCYNDNGIQNQLYELLNHYKNWAKQDIFKGKGMFHDAVLFSSLYFRKILIRILHIKQSRI